MESRVASVKALEQMGFKKEKGKEFGIVQLHEKIKDIIAEEMAADALEYGYEPMTRKAGSGEHRKHSDVDTFRELAEREENLIRQEAGLQLERENLDDLRVKQEDTQKKLDNRDKNQRRLVNAVYRVLHELSDNRTKFSTYAEMVEAVKAAKENFVDTTATEARQKAQEEAAAEFQRKEDALEAQKTVLDELKKLRDRMQLSVETDTSRKRFMEAHRAGGRTLEEIYQADIAKKQAQDEAFLRRGEELTAEYDAVRTENISDPQKV